MSFDAVLVEIAQNNVQLEMHCSHGLSVQLVAMLVRVDETVVGQVYGFTTEQIGQFVHDRAHWTPRWTRKLLVPWL